jgi:glycosyltransferase involved in cell wall biosynthesis
VYFTKLKQFWTKLGISTVYTPHKCLNEDMLGSIKLIACPLYAVNIEDEARNSEFKKYNLLIKPRKYFYSFAGGYQPDCYLTDIRLRIFNLNNKKRPDCMIRNTGDWHFNCDVYGGGQDVTGKLNEDDRHLIKTNIYNCILLDSRYALAPSGSGPNSIRFWEALGAGAIPILLADTLELPEHKLWDKSIVCVKENELDEEEQERRENCMKIYKHFRNNFKNKQMPLTVIHYCCGSYYKGNFGGVARYDYHISKAFPNYKHFTGPHEKNQLLSFLNSCKNPLVITDNHLACDIPNKYETILVHHGVAETHAAREPDWDKYWKDLCCNGQKKMLYHRDPNRTRIISISQFCTDEFTKYYGETYTRFPLTKILHTSELDKTKYKTNWNNKPIILGNWQGVNKGRLVVNNLSKLDTFIFKKLSVYPKVLSQTGIDDFNRRKQDIYLTSDIFLQISLCEGNSYATLDALLCGIPVVSTNTGLFYSDVPDDCCVKIDWKRRNDLHYIKEKLEYAWKHKEEIGKKGRDWYLKHCGFGDWKNKMHQLVINM